MTATEVTGKVTMSWVVASRMKILEQACTYACPHNKMPLRVALLYEQKAASHNEHQRGRGGRAMAGICKQIRRITGVFAEFCHCLNPVAAAC